MSARPEALWTGVNLLFIAGARRLFVAMGTLTGSAMREISPAKSSRDQSGHLDDERVVLMDDLAQLRHMVLNDYQAVIACIFDEGARSTSPDVKEALSRVADCVLELASLLRLSESNGPTPASFDFGPSKI